MPQPLSLISQFQDAHWNIVYCTCQQECCFVYHLLRRFGRLFILLPSLKKKILTCLKFDVGKCMFWIILHFWQGIKMFCKVFSLHIVLACMTTRGGIYISWYMAKSHQQQGNFVLSRAGVMGALNWPQLSIMGGSIDLLTYWPADHEYLFWAANTMFRDLWMCFKGKIIYII